MAVFRRRLWAAVCLFGSWALPALVLGYSWYWRADWFMAFYGAS